MINYGILIQHSILHDFRFLIVRVYLRIINISIIKSIVFCGLEHIYSFFSGSYYIYVFIAIISIQV